MYMGQIDIGDRGRYTVNYPRPRHLRMVSDYPGDDIQAMDGLGIFGGKKKKRRRAAAKAEATARELRIANLEKLALARMAPAPVTPAPAQVAPVAAPIAPVPVVNIQAPAPTAKVGLPTWAIPAGIGGALLLVAVIVLPQMKKAK